MELRIGADPEFFLKKDGKFVSAHGIIEGTKKNPQEVKGGAVQVDGMALEFNIDPASNSAEFVSNVATVLGELRKMVPAEYEFAFVPVADFDPAYIADQPEEARILGCEPDFNAYTGKANPQPDAAKSFRTASGHIHLGWTENEDINNPEHIDACQMMVKQLDSSVGLSSIVIDWDKRRRELYGKAGAYRPKPYGVEYRTMSNFWLRDVAVQEMVFDQSQKAFNHLIKGTAYVDGLSEEGVAKWINNSMVEKAAYYSVYYTGSYPIVKTYYAKWKRANEKPVDKVLNTGTGLQGILDDGLGENNGIQPGAINIVKAGGGGAGVAGRDLNIAFADAAQILWGAPNPRPRGRPAQNFNVNVWDAIAPAPPALPAQVARAVGPNLRRDRFGRFVGGDQF